MERAIGIEPIVEMPKVIAYPVSSRFLAFDPAW